MARTRADLFIHPIRSRILTVMMGRRLTTGQIAQLLPDIPVPSLYRHVRLLAEHGVLEAVDKIRVKGAPTRIFAVGSDGARITVDRDAADPREEHMRGFTHFLQSLEETFRAYLSTHSISPDEPVQALMEPLALTREECVSMQAELDAFLERWRGRTPQGDRRRFVFARVFLPDRPDPPVDDITELTRVD